jgi:hypothetical protein
MKSQVLITQFIIFFVIGLTIFLAVGNIFRLHSNSGRSDIINSSIKLENSFISSAVITVVSSCKDCDIVSINLKTEESTAGYFTVISLENGLNISTIERSFSTSIHNMNESINIVASSASSTKPITLTFDRTKNNLMIK